MSAMDVLRYQKANCKDCYKCIRRCAVKAIAVRDHHTEVIDEDCVLCGRCVLTCPQYANQARWDIQPVRRLLQSERPVYAMVAPSFSFQDGPDAFGPLRCQLMALGFTDAFESAEGACLVKNQYQNLVAKRWGDVILTSCCPSVVLLVERHFPSLTPLLAPVLSPMQAEAKLLRRRFGPEAAVVYIGSCIAAKNECDQTPGLTDYALTYDELNALFVSNKLPVDLHGAVCAPEPRRRSRSFPLPGGVIGCMDQDPEYSYLAVDGLENCIAALNEIKTGRLHNCFIELRSCTGSCAGGPKMSADARNRLEGRVRIANTANGGEDFEPQPTLRLDRTFHPRSRAEAKLPTEQEIDEILRRLGKNSPADQLNCGTCGYPTCRDKAVAIYQGKADVTMCLPYMKKRAESLSDKIISNSPTAILAVDSALRVRMANRALRNILGIQEDVSLSGLLVSELMDDFEFITAFSAPAGTKVRKAYLEQYDKYVEQIFAVDEGSNMAICMMKDITAEEKARRSRHKTRQEAVDIADQIIAKQMRIVHEIASLLGETAAETKVALTRLKSTVAMDEGEEDRP